MKKMFVAIAISALTIGVASAQEKSTAWDTKSIFSDVGVTLKGGTAGVGFDVIKGINDNFKVRAGWSDYKYSNTYDQDQVSYDAKLRLGGWNVLGDWHPWGGGWRLTGGVYGPSHKLGGSGKFTGTGDITINGTTYTAADLGSVDVQAKWNGIKPYLGIGYDGFNNSKNGGLFFTADFGVIFAGSPKVSLTANCINPAVCTAVEADRAAEEAKIRNDLNSAKYLPVAQIGIGYRF